LRVKRQTIHPAKHLTGGLELPGDKSISHRYAMLAALAEGRANCGVFQRQRIATAPSLVWDRWARK